MNTSDLGIAAAEELRETRLRHVRSTTNLRRAKAQTTSAALDPAIYGGNVRGIDAESSMKKAW